MFAPMPENQKTTRFTTSTRFYSHSSGVCASSEASQAYLNVGFLSPPEGGDGRFAVATDASLVVTVNHIRTVARPFRCLALVLMKFVVVGDCGCAATRLRASLGALLSVRL